MYRLRWVLLAAALVLPGAASQTAPPVPGFGGAYGESTSSIRWRWSNVAGETGYVLHDGAHVQKADALAEAVDVVEGGLAENTAYQRHVHAVNGTVASGPSASQTRYTLVRPLSDADLVLTAISPTEALVAVTPPANAQAGSTGVKVIWWNGSSWQTLTDSKGLYAFAHAGLSPGSSVDYAALYKNGDAWPNAVYGPTKRLRLPSSNGLASPAGLQGVPQSTASVLWSWTAVSGASGYALHDALHQPKGTAAAPATSLTESGLAENAAVDRHLHATSFNGSSTSSALVRAYTAVHTPLASDFALAALGGDRVRITITAPPNAGQGQTGVEIQERIGGTWTVARAFSGEYTHEISLLTPNTTYTYRIRYRNQGGTPTAASPLKSVTTGDAGPPSAPVNVRTTSYSGIVDVEWDAPKSPNVAGYNVYRKTGTAGTWAKLNTTGIVLITKYRDATAVNGQTYYYRVTAVQQ